MPMPKGFIHTKRTKMKMKMSRDAAQAPFKGKSHTKRTKLLMSMNMTGKNNPMFGKKLSEATKQKIREAKTKKLN